MIIFLGAPGAGKGTQSRLLAQRYGFKVISIGEILREEIENQTEIGIQVKDLLKVGSFVDSEIVVNLVKSKINGESRFILDGFPRNLEQAQKFEEFILHSNDIELKNLFVFDFVVPINVVRDRLTLRKLCKACDAAFFSNETKCAFCGNQEYKIRDDDCEEVIEKRIKKFLNEHEELVNFYKAKGVYYPIQADKDVEKVYQDIVSCVHSKNLI